jgi:integrase
MAARKRSKTGLPPGGRETSPGKISIQFPVPQPDGTIQRLSQQKAMPGEPKSYEGIPAAWAGYTKVTEYLTRKVANGVTLLEFWTDWTDTNHWRWGKKRSPQTIKALTSRTRAFVERYGNQPIAGITERHFELFMRDGGLASQLKGLGVMFNDAETANLLAAHPCRQIASESDKADRAIAKSKKPKSPTQEQVDAMLDRAQEPCYPRSIYGWLLMGSETGMRSGELDAAAFGKLDGNRYYVDEQFNHALQTWAPPKHDSYRTILLPDEVVAALDEFRGDDPIDGRMFTNTQGAHWRSETRDYWWNWSRDGRPSLCQLVGGMTMYEATRHFWASRAINVWGLEPYPVSIVYGHKDGGKILIKHYLSADEDAANARIGAARDAYETSRNNVIDLRARRSA